MTRLAAGFPGEPLLLERAGYADSGEWVLGRPFSFYSAKFERLFTVPAGAPTDLASVPRLPVVYWLTGGTADEAAVFHDHGYRGGFPGMPRADVDALFAEIMAEIRRLKREALAAKGAPAWRRGLAFTGDKLRGAIMYAGVRVGGGSSYQEREGTVAPEHVVEPVAP